MIKSALIILFIICFLKISAQPAGSSRMISSAGFEKIDISSLSVQQKNWLEKIYNNSVTSHNELINGKEYMPYYYRSGTNPLLLFKSNRTATLFFRDMQFKNISLQYDTFLDEVIYTDVTRIVNGSCQQIALNKDNIRGFNLYFDYDSLIFRYLRFSENDAETMTDGYYEVVYEAKTRFIIRHRSTMYNKEGLDKYEYSPERYILSGDKWVKITSGKTFLKIFGTRSKEIAGLLHKSKIKIKTATKGQIADLLKYYDSSEKHGS